MKFPYLKFPIQKLSCAFPDVKIILRPIIRITLGCKDRKVNYFALIDSGADYCFFHREIREFLDVDV